MIPRLIIATLLLATAGFAQNLDSRMDQIVQSYASNRQFMGSVLVARDNEVLFSKGYGSANLEWELPKTPSTKFRLGSITKQFTAASILLLEERGRLNVEDPVKKYLPDAPAAWDKITIFHVLTHTAGILDNNQLMSKLGNQAAIPIFPQAETRFFPKVVDAELEFSGRDAQGRATQLTLRQNGRDTVAKRLDDAEFKRLAEADAELQKRIKAQTPAPGSEAAVRRVIEELRSGQPNYDLMSPGLAAATRQQLPGLQSSVQERGDVRSITFKGVGPAGADIYEIQFEKGALEYRISLGPDGKVQGANVRPLN